MGFLDLFRPKWRHSDSETRIEAIRELAPDELQILSRVAREDEDARVRRAAVKRIQDSGILEQIAGSDTDEGVRNLAASRAAELLLAAASEATDDAAALQALASLAKLDDAKAIAKLACRSTNQAVWKQAIIRLGRDEDLAHVVQHAQVQEAVQSALSRIQSAALLCDLAQNDRGGSIGVAAVSRIEDLAVLERIASGARVKAVRAAARGRLPANETKAGRDKQAGAQVDPAAEKTRKARLLQLCIAAEGAARRADREAAAKEMALLQAQWDEIGATAKERALDRRFAKAKERLATRQQAEKQASERAAAAKRGARQETTRHDAGQDAADVRPDVRPEDVKQDSGGAAAKGNAAETRDSRKASRRDRDAQRKQGDTGEGGTRAARDGSSKASGGSAAASAASNDSPDFGASAGVEAGGDAGAATPAVPPAPGRTRIYYDLLESLCSEVERLRGPSQLMAERLAELEQRWKGLRESEAPSDSAATLAMAAETATVGAAPEPAASGTETAALGMQGVEESGVEKSAVQAQTSPDALAAIPSASAQGGSEAFQANDRASIGQAEPAVAVAVAAEAGPVDRRLAGLERRFAHACTKTARRIEESSRREKQRTEIETALASVYSEANELLASGQEDARAIETLLKTTGTLMRQVDTAGGGGGGGDGGEQRSRLREVTGKLTARLNELRDAQSWKRWANVPKLEELCKEAETLAEVLGDFEDKRRAPLLLKDLRGRWKALGPIPRERAEELRVRFDKACDTVHSLCREYFDKLDQERAANLAKKEDL
ncbi:MAG: DUF349 domain-containing protein, partial [Pseudomonadota bacterium]